MNDVVKEVLPDRYNEFVKCYTCSKRKEISYSNFSMYDFLIGISVSRGGVSMEMYIIIALIVLIIGIITFTFYNRKSKETKKEIKKEISLSVYDKKMLPDIQIIENFTLIPSEKNKIVDTKVKNAISVLDNSVIKSVMVGKNFKNANTVLNSNRAFFSAARSGTENMMKVKGTNELLGTQAINGKITQNTKFIREDQMMANVGKDALVNAGFNVASMVVGQYYMNEINVKLENIQHDIDSISNFLDTQYKGKLIYIVSKIEEILENREDILTNNFSKDKRYDEISRAEESCVELLTQANVSIAELLRDELNYKNYERNTKDIQKWLFRQQILTRLLAEIGDLRYVLADGNETSKSSHSQYNKCLKHTNTVNEELDKWHETYCKKFGINKDEHRRKATFFEIRKNTIGRINEEWAYNKLNENTEMMIDAQMNINKLLPYNTDKLDKNIKILKYKGEYYNLPKSSE